MTKFDEAGNLLVFGFDPLDAVGGIYNMLHASWGIDIWNEDAWQYNFDDPRTAEWLAIIKRFYDAAGGADKARGFRATYGTEIWSPQAALPSGVQGMEINGAWTPGTLASLVPHRKFGFSWLPQPPEREGLKVQTVCGAASVIPKDAKHPEEAWVLAEWLAGDPMASDIFWDVTGWTLMVRKNWEDTVDLSKAPGIEFYLNSLRGGADKLYAESTDPISAFTGKTWKDITEAVIYGSMTPEEGAKQMHTLCNEELQRQG